MLLYLVYFVKAIHKREVVEKKMQKEHNFWGLFSLYSKTGGLCTSNQSC